jgi:hypothetical protein
MNRVRISSVAHRATGHILVALLAGTVLWVTGCGDGPVEPTDMVDSGSWYVTGFRWPHDGNPYESENFEVFSDAASEQSRRSLAQIGEDVLADLVGQFDATGHEIFLFPTGQEKIHMYAYKNRFPQQWGGWAYYGGLLIYSLDHEERGLAGHTALDMYVPVVRHEVMHVMESLMKASNNPETVDVWLTEGVAEFVSGGTAGGSIEDVARLNELVDAYGGLNPISIHRYTDYPDQPMIAFEYLYPMFQMAAEYLFDERGIGATLGDLRDLYLDVRGGTLFAEAFENRFGISVADYEAQFFGLVSDYLTARP